MKNLINSVSFVLSAKGIMVLLVLIFPYNTIASGENQKNHQENLLNWLSPLDPDLSETNLVNNGNDEIFINGFEFVPMACSDPLINPVGIQRDLRNTIFITDGARSALNGVEPQYPQDQNWPGLSDPIRTSVANNKYIALQFQTDITSYSIQTMFFKAAPISFGPPSAGITYSISECPGDFRQSLGQCGHNTTSQNQFRWSTTGEFTDAQVCNLDKNKTYYFNLISSIDDFNYSISSCASQNSDCGIIILNEQ